MALRVVGLVGVHHSGLDGFEMVKYKDSLDAREDIIDAIDYVETVCRSVPPMELRINRLPSVPPQQ